MNYSLNFAGVTIDRLTDSTPYLIIIQFHYNIATQKIQYDIYIWDRKLDYEKIQQTNVCIFIDL